MKHTLQPFIVSRHRGLATLLCLLALVMMAACAPQAAQNTAQDATEGVVAENLPPAEQTQVMVTAEGETQLYADAVLGFSFEYPTTWTIQGNEGSSVVLLSFPMSGDQTAEPIPADIPAGGTRIDITPMSEGYTSLDNALKAVRTSITENGATIASDEAVALSDNVPAQRIKTSAGSDLLVTQINERVLLITAQGDTAPLELIQSTLRDAN